MSDAVFLKEVEDSIQIYELATGYRATRTRQMIDQHGEVEALSLLMMSADLQQGFKVMRDSGQLDKTFEAVVRRYQNLFDAKVVQAAQWRYDHPYELL